MRRAISVLPSGSWPSKAEKATVTLVHDQRHRRRIRLDDDNGESFLLDLAETVRLADGDGLALEDGGVLRIVAAPEDVAEILCSGNGHLARIAWHLGNRHLPVQIVDDRTLRIAWDHVIADMIAHLGADVWRQAPFQPEAGAYDAPADRGDAHRHDHIHPHGHDHA